MRVDVWRGRAQAEVGGLDGWQTCATSGRHVQHLADMCNICTGCQGGSGLQALCAMWAAQGGAKGEGDLHVDASAVVGERGLNASLSRGANDQLVRGHDWVC